MSQKHHLGFSAEGEEWRKALEAWQLVETAAIGCEDDWPGSFLPMGVF